jgi:polyhydroxybutyrate depolymerase
MDGSSTRRRTLPLALAVLAAALVACRGLPAQEPPAPAGAGDHEVGLRSGGLDRYYLLHVPPAAPAAAPRPLVLVLHGGGGNPEGMAPLTGMDRLADREGFLVAYPAGTGVFARKLLTWNAGPACCGWARDHEVDDVAFLRAVVADVGSRCSLDRRRVYATGMSNGAMMCYRLAAEAGDLVAAVGPVAGAMLCPPPRPDAPAVPVLHIHSVDDPRALYEGGLGPPFPLTNARVQHPPVMQTIDAWVRHDGCPAEPAREAELRGVGRDAGDTAERLTWGPGRGGAEVVLWRLHGPGHIWPGGPQYLPARLVGRTTSVIDASRELWAFFRRFAR